MRTRISRISCNSASVFEGTLSGLLGCLNYESKMLSCTEFDLWSSTVIVLTDWHTSSFRFVADCSKTPSSYLNGHFYELARSFFPLYQPQVSFPSFVLFSGTYNKTTSSCIRDFINCPFRLHLKFYVFMIRHSNITFHPFPIPYFLTYYFFWSSRTQCTCGRRTYSRTALHIIKKKRKPPSICRHLTNSAVDQQFAFYSVLRSRAYHRLW